MAKANKKLSYSKCAQCRKDRQKCLPERRTWPGERCNRCTKYDYTCSANTSKDGLQFARTSSPRHNETTTSLEASSAVFLTPAPILLPGKTLPVLQEEDYQMMTEFRKLCPGENGSYILHCAIKLDSIIMVRWLLARGADIDHKIDGNTALHEAILCNYREIVDILLDHGADPNVEDSLSRTPLYLAVYNEDVEVVSILLDRDANIEISDNTGKTPLHRAAIAGSEKIAQLLLNAGANPSAVENDGGTPLHIAVDYKNARMVSILLDNGANVDAKKKNGETPLHEAAISGSEKIARLLLTAKADFSAVDVDGETPLHFAISVRDSVVASILLEYGSDVNVKTGSFDRTPLHLAAHMSRWDIAQVLLEYGASLSAVDYYHETPLHTAVRCAPLDFLRQLLNYIKQKCDLNVLNAQPGRDGFTALRMAIDRGSADHVEMLLRNGARFTLCSASGESDLDAALESSNERIKKSGQDFTEWMAMEGRPSLPGLPGHTPSSWS